MINLNNRLKLCADFVTSGGVSADVGTDHGYLASYLILNKISKKVFACDINEKPLNSARQTVEKLNLSDKVEVILSDGLKNVPNENITDVIIAGMGGELISQIIADAQWVQRSVNLVLQPMTKSELLRKWLYANGYKIVREQAVTDEKFTYIVIQSVYCGEFIRIDDYFSFVGLVDKAIGDGKKYLLITVERLKNIAEGLKKSEEKKDEAKHFFELSGKIKSLVED